MTKKTGIVVVLKSGQRLQMPVESQADANEILAACRQVTTPPVALGTTSSFQPPCWLPMNGALVLTSEVAAIYIVAPLRDNGSLDERERAHASFMEAIFGK